MGPEFAVLAVGLYPTAVCQGELTPLHPTEPPPPPVDEMTPMGSSEEYLVRNYFACETLLARKVSQECQLTVFFICCLSTDNLRCTSRDYLFHASFGWNCSLCSVSPASNWQNECWG